MRLIGHQDQLTLLSMNWPLFFTPMPLETLKTITRQQLLSTSQNIQYIACPATGPPVEFCVTAVGTWYGSELLILKVKKPRHTWTRSSNFSTGIFCSRTFHATEWTRIHNTTPYSEELVHYWWYYNVAAGLLIPWGSFNCHYLLNKWAIWRASRSCSRRHSEERA